MSLICTSDVEVCDDGSYVSRNADANCTFFPCPLAGFNRLDLHVLCNCITTLNLCAESCAVFDAVFENIVDGQNITQCRQIEEEACGVNITSPYNIFCEGCALPPPRPPNIPYPPDQPYYSNPNLGSTNLGNSPPVPFYPHPSPPFPTTPPVSPSVPIPRQVLPNENMQTVLIISGSSLVTGIIALVIGCVLEPGKNIFSLFEWQTVIQVE